MNNDSDRQKADINLSGRNKKKSGSFDKFSFSLWLVKNRRNFFIAAILFLILLSVSLYLFSFYNFFDYLSGRNRERQTLEELTDISVTLTPGRQAIPLESGSVQFFPHQGRYDFIASVKNPNSNFLAQVNYCFLDGEVELVCRGATIFPEESKYLISLALPLDSRPSDLKFIFKNVSWQRLDAKKYPDWKSYYSSRNDFSVSESEFIAERVDSSSSYLSQVSFSIKNNSAFNYWEVPLNIILFNNNSLVGINRYVVTEFMSLSEKQVNLSWLNSVRSVNRILISPDLNVLDEDNYIKY